MTDTVSSDTERHTGNIAAQIEQRRAGRRKRVMHGGTLCGKCLESPPAKGQRHCRKCHNEAARESARRKSSELKRLRCMNTGE